ncbi:MAG: patatin-like phospholipase family protein [Ktedonobacterales bacterium]
MGAMAPRNERVTQQTVPATGQVASQGYQGPYERQRVRRPRWHDYTAFVLSGGGARGALQVGALRALLERDIQPDVIVGTSIGAWNGAWLAAHPTLGGMDELADIWRGLRSEQVLLGRDILHAPPQALTGVLMLAAAQRMTRGYPSLYSDAGVRQLLTRSVGDRTFADLQTPLHIIAADLTSGTRAIFNEGPLIPAILASSAIPGVFPPVRIGDSVYADGCALDSCSIETALQQGARRLFVLAVGYENSEEDGAYWSSMLAPVTSSHSSHSSSHTTPRAKGEPSHGMAAIFERITQVVSLYQLQQALQRIPRGVETHVIFLPTGHGANMLDFSAANEWMKSAYIVASQYLDTHLERATSQGNSAVVGVAEAPTLPPETSSESESVA